jgi:hypothetical protein
MQRMSIKDSMIIGVGMVPRGEVAMICGAYWTQPESYQPEYLLRLDLDESFNNNNTSIDSEKLAI